MLHNLIKNCKDGNTMFSKRIKYLRISKGLNQVQLAQKLNVRKQSISNWENGNIMPSIDMLERIADFFSVSTDYLLGREQTFDNITKVDVTGLDSNQIHHICQIVDDIRNSKIP